MMICIIASISLKVAARDCAISLSFSFSCNLSYIEEFSITFAKAFYLNLEQFLMNDFLLYLKCK